VRRAVGYVVGDCRRPKEVDVIEPQFGKLPLLTFNINISGQRMAQRTAQQTAIVCMIGGWTEHGHMDNDVAVKCRRRGGVR